MTRSLQGHSQQGTAAEGPRRPQDVFTGHCSTLGPRDQWPARGCLATPRGLPPSVFPSRVDMGCQRPSCCPTCPLRTFSHNSMSSSSLICLHHLCGSQRLRSLSPPSALRQEKEGVPQGAQLLGDAHRSTGCLKGKRGHLQLFDGAKHMRHNLLS